MPLTRSGVISLDFVSFNIEILNFWNLMTNHWASRKRGSVAFILPSVTFICRSENPICVGFVIVMLFQQIKKKILSANSGENHLSAFTGIEAKHKLQIDLKIVIILFFFFMHLLRIDMCTFVYGMNVSSKTNETNIYIEYIIDYRCEL